MTGLGADLGPREIMRLARDPSGIESLLLSENSQGLSTAMVFADVVNILRADTRALADAHGVDVRPSMMSDERAAELLASVVAGDGKALLEAFETEAERRDKILRAVLDEDAYETFMTQKIDALYTDAEGFDE